MFGLLLAILIDDDTRVMRSRIGFAWMLRLSIMKELVDDHGTFRTRLEEDN